MSAAEQPLRFLVLASGQGTNAKKLFEYARQHPERLEPVALVSDRDAPALGVAEEWKVPAHLIRPSEEGALLQLLDKLRPDWACMAGYKRLVSASFLEFFHDENLGFRVMNVHPSLLPAYPGLGGYRRAFEEGCQLSGVTVHLVDEGLDTGLPILQASFAREENDTLETFTAKGRALEHQLFPQALDLASRKKLWKREREGARWIARMYE